jgi:hypothetical protein
MNAAVSRGFRLFDVVILVQLVTPLVAKPSIVKLCTKSVQVVHRLEDEPTPGDIVHSGKLHIRVPLELADYGGLSFMPLCHNDIRPACFCAQNRLERVEHRPMCGPPLLKNQYVGVPCSAVPDCPASCVDP